MDEGQRDALIDEAMHRHGHLPPYADLRQGLEALRRDCRVTLTELEHGVRVDAVPHDGHGHEVQFVVTWDGRLEGFSAGH